MSGTNKPVIWLREGHVCGFTLPLSAVIEERWKAGHLIRVNEDGSTFQGPHFILPGADLEADDDEPGTGGGNGPVRPKKNAGRVQWAAYAIALGACTEDEADDLNRDQLIALVIPPEEKPGNPT
jgi:hypothetical protein